VGNVRNVLYCSMGLEHYESLMGIGFAGYFIYNVLLFYISIKAYDARRVEASALCEGGLPKGEKIFRFHSFMEQ
jgi:hypothetical protein